MRYHLFKVARAVLGCPLFLSFALVGGVFFLLSLFAEEVPAFTTGRIDPEQEETGSLALPGALERKSRLRHLDSLRSTDALQTFLFVIDALIDGMRYFFFGVTSADAPKTGVLLRSIQDIFSGD